MRQVALAAGVRPAPSSDCTTSALVFLVNDKPSFLKLLKAKFPEYFRFLEERSWSPRKESGPVQSWQITQQVNPDGAPMFPRPRGLAGAGPRVVASRYGGSRILSMITVEVAMSVVVIERASLRGLTTTQVADFALMRTLYRIPGALTHRGSQAG